MVSCFLCHTVGELCSADYVEVEVLDGLTTVLTHVAYHSVAVVETESYCEAGNYGEDVCDNVGVILVDLVNGCDMLLGYYEKMNGSLRIDIEKCIALVILVHLF